MFILHVPSCCLPCPQNMRKAQPKMGSSELPTPKPNGLLAMPCDQHPTLEWVFRGFKATTPDLIQPWPLPKENTYIHDTHQVQVAPALRHADCFWAPPQDLLGTTAQRKPFLQETLRHLFGCRHGAVCSAQQWKRKRDQKGRKKCQQKPRFPGETWRSRRVLASP